MRAKLLMSTALVALALGTVTASAQTKTTDQTNQKDRNGNPVRVIDTKRPDATMGQSSTAPAASTTAPASTSSANSATPAQNTPAANQPASSTSQPATAQSAPASSSTQPSTAQSTSTTPNAATSATTPSANQPAAAQNTQPSAAQPSTASGATPAQPNTAQQSAPAANQAATTNGKAPVQLSASLQVEQKNRLTQAFTAVEMKPVQNVNFSVAIGSTIPRTVEFRPLPASVVSIIPQYRGYNYVLVRNEIVIIEPGTSRIVDVIERGGPSQARSTTTTERSANLTKQQRDYIREKSARRTTTTTTTTGSAPRPASPRVRVGDRIPDTVEIETFPEEVYREVPTMRSYRYMRGERGIYLVDPQRRTIIEDLDD